MAFKYEFYFINKGKTRDSHTAVCNEVWLDVGCHIEKGTFDHYNCAKGYMSTVDVLVHETGLLEETKEGLDPDQAVRIYLHVKPDIDALFSVYLFMYFLENGKEAFNERFIRSRSGQKIITYVNDINTGIRKNIDSCTLYNMVCHLDIDAVREYWHTDSDVELSHKMAQEALGWIDIAVRHVEKNPCFNLYDQEIPLKEEDTAARKIAESIAEAGKRSYERDKKEGRLVIKDISIWTKDGTTETVKAAIWKAVPLSPASAYLYARKEGAAVTFVPHNEYGNNAARVAVNPDIEGAVDKYTLREVGEMYEQMEQIYDRQQLLKTGALRRDYSRPRGDGECKVFLEKPFSLTSDPWCVSDKGDMVDAPGHGSALPVETMIEVLENITKMVKRTYIVQYDLNIEKKEITPEVTIKDKNAESFLTWAKDIKTKLANMPEGIYPFVIVEIDASLIAHHYNILDAYFMSLSDGAYVDAKESGVLRLDYRTHLYMNQMNAVLFAATSDKTSENVQMGCLLDWTDKDTVKQSSIIKLFSKVLYQREKFKELGRFLGTCKENGKIRRKKEELIALLARAQADECIDTQVELDVFQFLYNTLNVSDLRSSVSETMNLVSEYSKEKVYANLNFLSMITIPFILISTLFQAGVFHFKPLIDLEGETTKLSAGIPWLVSLGIVILITLILYFVRRRR